jgi:hypothetical protein
MQGTLIQQEEGSLGQFPQLLKLGDIQSLVFLLGSDAGPFWMMSDAEKPLTPNYDCSPWSGKR